MSITPRAIIAAVLVLLGARASAQAPSYLSLVGELYGAVEFPRLLRDYCGDAQPETRAELASRYEQWATSNAAFLTRVREQYSRADARLQSQGTTLAQLDPTFVQQFESLGPARLCVSYDATLAAKQAQFAGELAQLLEAVERADAELTAQGRAR